MSITLTNMAQRILASNNLALAGTLQSLSSGVGISASTDPAGMIASLQLQSELAGMQAEASNLQRTYNVASVADGSLAEISSQLNEAYGLAVANASDGLSAAEKQANQDRIDSILASVDRTASTSTFAGDSLLNGKLTLSAGESTYAVPGVSTASLGEVEDGGASYVLADAVSGGVMDTTTDGATLAAQSIRTAIQDVATLRGELGAFQADTVQTMASSLSVTSVNLAGSISAIYDTDYAAESAQLTRGQLLAASSLLVLQMTNQSSSGVLALLQTGL